ncbi:BREX-1 system adenine-specific DNA-methyltransferase PglX [Neolewinella aurantiaca]|uniref:site-specific DNA-methyltransferase (adenine-specific) n=1 Tax=Neolewinella aurantiaca TaxID=2602767 RepID=A0A5C7F6G2_9BACT|nr:BREX-1 system adenine-specific DNA-methyltransferase PglX [Neolewinella aurantiaca]TXF86311.1 BREX-1 system adenine-specific DNA-methyltransferase PglX [Neolewinella aurantiaca]
MNTSLLKNFAQQARTQLIAQVEVQLDRALNATGALAQEFAAPIKALNDGISRHGRAHVVEEAAYLWFNRFVALRFMDVNHYADLRAVSPATEADALPELLQLAKAGQLPDDLQVNHARLNDLLDGRLPSTNPEAEVYRILLRAECNRRHTQLPFLFERITDYSELLLPADLLSQQSILHQLRETLTPAVCEDNEEVIGWLYQFYISEKKDAVFAAKGKVKKADIPAVTQLFTPRWIVEYMVQNTLGKLWLQSHPDSSLREFMPYYLESAETPSPTPPHGGGTSENAERFLLSESLSDSTSPLPRGEGPGEGVHEQSELFPAAANRQRQPRSESNIANRQSPIANRPTLTPQELTLADQACGSGHILLYAFELLTRIYEESGYAKSEIPGLILAHNLTGFEIDERAAQLAAFTLMMRARRYHRRALRQGLRPNIVRFRDLTLTGERELPALLADHGIPASKELLHDLTLMQQATNFGSLITPTATTEEIQAARTQVQSKLGGADLFATNALQQLDTALHQLAELSRKFWCVVDNPPYHSSTDMNANLLKFVKFYYPRSSRDLMTCFMERGLSALKIDGFMGLINQQSWMFGSSLEKLRLHIFKNFQIDTMVHLGPRAFPEIGGEVVQSTAFTIQLREPSNKGLYLRLVNDRSTLEKEAKTREIAKTRIGNYAFTVDQSDFVKLPGTVMGYWLSNKLRNSLASDNTLDDIGITRRGLQTGRAPRFIRYWYEVSNQDFVPASEYELLANGKGKWFVFNSGGEFTKWYGNMDQVVLWKDSGVEIKAFPKSIVPSEHLYGLEAVTWNKITSNKLGFKINEKGVIPGDASPAFFLESDGSIFEIAAALNSKVNTFFLKLYSPTLNAQVGDIKKLPIRINDRREVRKLAGLAYSHSRKDWHNKEYGYEYNGGVQVADKYVRNFLQDLVKERRNDFLSLHRVEEELNGRFIKSFDLQEEYDLNVPLQDITILQQELDRKALAALNDQLKRDPDTGLVTNYDELELPFKRDIIMQQFVSYAVGCMLGRYSLDKEGLILANAGDTLQEYAEKVGKGEAEWTFAPDEDGILPVLAGEYFPDDIVGRFRVFLRAAFGEAHFVENLAFVEECLGKDIRSYFVKDFYKDHVKRYKKRPIYWMFQSPGKHFRALVYLHRYQPDTVGRLLNDYLRPFIDRLTTERDNAQQVKDDAGSTAAAIAQARKTIEYANAALRDCEAYQKDLLELARRRIPLDLDDGVLVNYNKMGDAVETITGVNDAKGRKKVMGFDWVEWEW